ncbi:hypothetical protein [Mammaliicoccus stepanovicii]|uniref:Yip1 domain n=1 Tax=Mammaliicoccus stepanovicii TaxID=643214 RepID=A0A239YBZ2_9STAP|nr:hypothetical protein [Mammaliicoccus stepanovicii]PNZ75457.1 hypothetical protein CD111_07200 [Mammaliicoccus stepanovicii]GGI43047.1 hypothetical protein GCM10010896_21490 [Mammaliicoccus stepanovicii]SNV55688.1 Yip1 domain [Mammaliicoccus stepanovicii]
MQSSNLPFMQHFESLRINPKYGLKLILVIILAMLTTTLYNLIIDPLVIYKDLGLSSKEIMDLHETSKKYSLIAVPFITLFMIAFSFLIVLIVSKIMKSDATQKMIFSATLSHMLITSILTFVIYFIQYVAGIALTDYDISSLNIFDKGNKVLAAFNLQTIFSAYVFGVLLYATCKLTKKASIIWAVVFFVLFTSFDLISSMF